MTAPNPYRAAIQKASEELDEITKRLEGMQELKKRKASLESFISWATRLLDESPESGPVVIEEPKLEYSAAPAISVGAHVVRVPLWKRIAEFMKDQDEPLTAKEVFDLLVSRNVSINGEHKIETVRASMLNRPDIFERVDSKWRLRPKGETQRFSGLDGSAAQERTH